MGLRSLQPSVISPVKFFICHIKIKSFLHYPFYLSTSSGIPQGEIVRDILTRCYNFTPDPLPNYCLI